jgi:crotonobetainyl-CoA:carnitine CoA-transferase CaiB-like acyl-CoA transferase
MDPLGQAARLASKQFGAISNRQARTCGLTRNQIRQLVRSERWAAVRRGVYIVAGTPASWEQRASIALLSCDDAALSSCSAGYVLELIDEQPHRIEVLALHGTHDGSGNGVVIRRAIHLEARDRRTVHGLRVTSPARTLVDIAAVLEERSLGRAVDRALLRGLTTVGVVRKYIADRRLQCRPGVGTLVRLLDDREFGVPESELERRTLELIEAYRLQAPARQQRVGAHRVDFLYPDHRLVVEVDGRATHGTSEAFEEDRVRQNALVLEGWCSGSRGDRSRRSPTTSRTRSGGRCSSNRRVTAVTDALEGVRVVDDTSGLAGPLAAMCLSDFGAQVAKVAKVANRRIHPVWDRGKRLIDPEARDGSLAGADVFVTNDAALGASARSSNPALVVLHVPSWMGEAPWAGGHESDALVAAMFGVSLRQASFDGGPIDSIYPVHLTIQGVWAAACAVAALLERERSGDGQLVTVSGEHGAMVAAGAGLTFTREALAAAPSEPGQPRSRPGGPGGSVPFYRTYQCADGEWLFFAALTPRFTQIGFETLGITEIFDDPRLEGRGRAAMLAPAHTPWVIDAIAQRFKTKPRDEWLGLLHANGCPVGPVLDRESWMDDPQVDAIGMRHELDDPALGRVVMPGVPLTLSATPGRVRGPAPVLGSSEPVTWEPHAPATRTAETSTDSTDGPIAGIRVLDLGAIIAGPFSASLLGDLGADVIKVEPLTGDSFRGPGFAAYNKGQRGVALDLRHPDGKAAFLDLVRTADVVIDNYRPGVLGRLGIEWEQLRETNPDVISVTITGFGNVGPHGSDAGFDPVLQAMGGMMRAQGGGGDGTTDWHPVFYTVPVNDVAGSATLALGTMLALFHRERTGAAQKVSTSLAAMSVLLQAEALLRYDGKPPAPVGSRDHLGPSPLARFYLASDGWFRIDAEHVPDAHARLSGAGVGTTNDLDAAITSWASARKRDDVLAQLFAAGIPAAAARTSADYADDEHMRSADVLHVDPRPDRDGFTAGRHAHFDRTMLSGALTSPRLGEHTREVLAEIGYDGVRVAELIASGAASAAD